MAKYDEIGQAYNYSRRADPFLVERMFALLQPQEGEHFVDVGCGTGNYTRALQAKGMEFTGVDPSEMMLGQARSLAPGISWIPGRAEALPLPEQAFEGALCSLTVHHWQDLRQGFTEIGRVLKAKGRLLVFSSDPKQMQGYWLNHYFPQMMRDSWQQMPSIELIESDLEAAGFQIDRREAYAVRPDLQDLFLYSGKHEPERYLDPQIRQNISSFSNLAHEAEVQEGLKRLREDIVSGRIGEVRQSFANEGGDYLFVRATRGD